MIHDDMADLLRDPQFRSDFQVLGQSALQATNLIIDKVLASFQNPSAFPLPQSPHSIEHVIRTRLEKLVVLVRTPASENAIRRLQSDPGQRSQRYGELASVPAG